MSLTQKRVLLICLLLAGAYFAVFWLPNSTASADINMVRALSPYEAVPLPYVFDMIKPAETVKQALINFAFYDNSFIVSMTTLTLMRSPLMLRSLSAAEFSTATPMQAA